MARRPARRFWTERRFVTRTLVVGSIAIALLWLTMAVTIANMVARTHPAIALAWWAPSAAARSQLAARLLSQNPTPTQISEMRRLSSEALKREPANVVAVRMLAIATSLRRDEMRARQLLAYAESLSRRDMPTHLLLIEEAVARNDIRAALRHYDRALRTSPRSSETLMPILVSASSEPAIARQLAITMSRRPPWWAALLDRLNVDAPSSVGLELIIRALRLDLSDSTERHLFANSLSRMAQLGDYRRAHALYADADPQGAGGTVRNGDFQKDSGIAPFNWVLVDEPGLGGLRQLRDAGRGDYALFLVAEHGRSGEVARQLLVLSPGRYRLSAVAGDVLAELGTRPVIAVVCAGEGGQTLAEIRMPTASAAGAPISRDLIVPASGCSAQFLLIRASSGFDEQSGTPWIDNLSVRRI